MEPMPACVTAPTLSVDLKAAGISAVVWATGYQLDFGWIGFDIFDAQGRPRHDRGISEVPGLCFLGLPWLSRRASPCSWGVWHDAAHLAAHLDGRMAALDAGAA
jgi:putative flavoprotein involved in K+ transport